MGINWMVAHLGLRNQELLYEEIGNSIAEILSAREKSECYEPTILNVSFSLFKILLFGVFLHSEMSNHLM